MKKIRQILLTVNCVLAVIVLLPLTAGANNIASSTMHFYGALTDDGGGVYTGTIAATSGEYYVPGGGGEVISTGGGFDVYAKDSGCAFVEGYYATGAWNCSGIDTYLLGSDHDAYPYGGPWGSFYDPDVADYYNYELTLTASSWYLRYNGTVLGNGNATPMSGPMDWVNLYAREGDVGAYISPPADPDANDGDAAAFGAGAGYWDMDWTWGSEAIPLELSGFSVVVTDNGSGQYEVTLTPAAQDLSYTVAPNNLADGPTFDNGQGGKPFGYDPDMPPPVASLQAGPPGFGESCFWSDVQGSAAGGGRDYTSLRLSPKDIFDRSEVTIGELANISYFTKNMDINLIDWQLKIYTESSVKWYGYRINYNRPSNPDNDWHQSSTTGLGISDIYDKVAGTSVPTSTDLDAEKILFVDIIAGYATNSPAVDSYLDGVRIELSNGDNATLNLAARSTVWVDDDYCYNCANDGHTWGFDAFDNIQDGVNAVDGSVVNVAAGTYEEQVVINKNLTLTGAGKDVTVIQSPVALTEYFTTSSNNYPVVYIHDTDNVAVENLTVDGLGRGNGNYRFQGIGFWNAGGSVNNVRLTAVRDTPFSGSQHGVSIYAYNNTGGPYNIEISGVDIDDMQKGGIALNGSGLTANVSNCTVTGNGPTTVTAQNGIQFYGPTGSITNCEVSGMSYIGPDWSASGILLYYPASGMILSNNSVHDCEGALNAYFADNMTMNNNNTFSQNEFVYIWGGDGIAVDNNTFSNNGEALYISDSTNLTVSSNTFNSDNNSVIIDGLADGIAFTENDITNSTYTAVTIQPYNADEPSNISFSNNNIYNNGFGMENTTSNMVNAENNWWGDAMGPKHVMTNPCAGGDEVSDNIDYSPWLDGAYPGGSLRSHNVENITQATTYNCIQEAIDAANNGDAISVLAGTYNETVNVDGFSGLTISGTDKTGVIVQPTSTLDFNVGGYGSARTVVFRVVNSTNIVLENMTMDLDLVKANLVHGILYWDSTGTVNNNILKNLAIPDASGGYYEIGGDYRAPGYSDLNRAEITISDNTFIDTGRLGVVTHDYVNATITGNTFYKTTDDFGYAIEIGGPSTATISGNTIYGFDTPAASDGSESAGIYIENAFTSSITTGIAKNVLVDNNEVYDSQYGMWIGNGYNGFAGDVDISVTLTNNSFHNNVDAAAIIQDEDKENGSSVSVSGGGNILMNNGFSGYYIYSQGDGDITVTLSGETITGHDNGIYVEDNATGLSNSSYSISIDHTSFSGNSSHGINNTVGSFIVNAEMNWWGDASGPYDGSGANEVPPCTGDSATEANNDGTGDEVSDNVDYCPWLIAPDTDGDGFYDEEDNCPAVYNPDQADGDGDGAGDVCDYCVGNGAYDVDGDGTCDGDDNCPDVPNGPDAGSCVQIVSGVLMSTGVVCTNYSQCSQEDLMCELDHVDLNGNSIGDACECYADCNNDGRVDIFDLAIMKNDYNRTDCPCDADLNDDDMVDVFDLLIIKNQYNRNDCPVIP